MAWLFHSNLKATSAALLLATLQMPYGYAQVPNAQQREKSLAKKLKESEARVKLLQERMERLESRFEMMAQERPSNPGLASTPKPEQQRAATPNIVPVKTQVASTTSPAVAPPRSNVGTFEVDEEAAQRALERTLTQSGVLLLPEGAFNITPSFSYTRNEINTGELLDVTNPITGASGLVLSDNRTRRNEFSARADLKYGLPKDAQLELGLPYNYVRSSTVSSFGDGTSDNGSGIGDITIGLAKTFMQEKGKFPDLIGRLTYNTGSGRKTDNQVSLGGGYRQVSGEVVALKRQDPLAFFAGASYSHVFEEDDIKPGNAIGLSLGAVLAASPATSLQFGFSQIHRQKQEVNGNKIQGSEQTYGIVNIGTSSILSRNTMLQATVGIGVGEDAPDYSFNLSLPINFD